jgi:pimeloyl-ACP methyl ester carboxylesterase
MTEPRQTPGTDFSAALIPGPWEHRFICANGSRFHAAVAGPEDADAPLVVLVHGFPQFWWAWRHQLADLAGAGYRTAALDLRGYAASDKPPRGHSLPFLAQDVAAVIASLGADRAVVAGQGLGGLVTWAMTAYCPDALTAAAVFDAAHPTAIGRVARLWVSPRAAAQALALGLPLAPERAILKRGAVDTFLGTWSAHGWTDHEAARLYRDMLRIPFAAAKAVEQVRWTLRSPMSAQRRRFDAQLARPARVPVLHVQGARDGLLRPTAVAAHALGGPDYQFVTVGDAGHFLPEEAPRRTSDLLLRWLDRVAGPGRR